MYIQETMELVKKAGIKLKNYKYLQVQEKTSNQDIVTQCDQEIEAYLKQGLLKLSPNSTFVGEESIQEMSDSMWIVDPIDGTTNFCNLHQDYTISVAYYEKYQPVFGVIYDVVQDILYVGIHGSGAYINGTKVEFNKKEVCISNSIMDASIHTLLSNPSLIDLSHKMRGHRSYGCATLGIIYVALQKIDMYVSSHCKVWDYAAAAIFLHELGGTWEMEHDFFSVTFNPCVFVRDPEMLHWIKK